MKISMRSLSVLVTAALVLASVGCASDQPTVADTGEIEWWNSPVEIRDAVVAVGSSRIIGNKSAARNSAEVDGMGRIARAVEAKVQQLMTNWFKEAGDNLDEATMSSYINNEGITRVVTDVEIVGASVAKYKEVDGYMYALIVLEDPAKWTQHVGETFKDNVLKDATLFKTEVMKQDFEAKLDALIEKDAEAEAALVERLTGG